MVRRLEGTILCAQGYDFVHRYISMMGLFSCVHAHDFLEGTFLWGV